LDADLAMKMSHALAQSPEPNTRAARLNLEQPLGRYSLAMILDFDGNPSSVFHYGDGSIPASGMPVYVGQSLLHNPEDCQLRLCNGTNTVAHSLMTSAKRIRSDLMEQ